MAEIDQSSVISVPDSEGSGKDWLLTAFLAYFLMIALVIMMAILIAWQNGS